MAMSCEAGLTRLDDFAAFLFELAFDGLSLKNCSETLGLGAEAGV